MTDRQKVLFSLLAGPSQSTVELGPAVIVTEWTVITGAPGSGKSTLCDGLAAAGHSIVPEVSRAAINEARANGFSIGEIFEDSALLARAIMSRKLGLARDLLPSMPCVWDTGLVDALVFCRRAKMDVVGLAPMLRALRYRRVIFLETFAQSVVQGDPVRPQSERDRMDLQDELLAEYSAQGYRLTRIAHDVPALRIQNVLAAI